MTNQDLQKVHATFLQLIEIIKPIEISKNLTTYKEDNLQLINSFDWTVIGLKVALKNINDKECVIIDGEGFGYTMPYAEIVTMYNKLKKVLPKYEKEYKLIFIDQEEIKSEPILVISVTEMTKYKTAAKMTVKSEPLRPKMECVYFGNGEICGTDSHKLYSDSFNSDKEVLLTKQMQNFVKDAKSFEVYDNENELIIKTPEKTQSFVKESQLYPQYRAVIPTNNPNYFEVDKKEFLKALKQTKHTANQASKLIVLEVNNNVLSLKGQDIGFSCASKTEINVISSNCNICFGLKCEFLESIINSTKGDILHFSLSDPSRPIMINKNFLIMPMMIENSYSETIGEYKEFEVKEVKTRARKVNAITCQEEKIQNLESKLFEEKIKENEKYNNMGFGHGQRHSKLGNAFTKRGEKLREQLKEAKEVLIRLKELEKIDTNEPIQVVEQITEPTQETNEIVINMILDYCEKTGYNVNEFVSKCEAIGGLTEENVNTVISELDPIEPEKTDLQLMYDISLDMQLEMYTNDVMPPNDIIKKVKEPFLLKYAYSSLSVLFLILYLSFALNFKTENKKDSMPANIQNTINDLPTQIDLLNYNAHFYETT